MTVNLNKIVLMVGKIIMILHLLRKLNPRRKRVVLIDRSDGLGDIIMWLPYAELYRKRYPASQYILKVLVWHHNQELLHFLKCLDEVLVIPPYKGKFSWLFSRLLFWLKNPADILIFDYVCNANKEFLLPYINKKVLALVNSEKTSITFLNDMPIVHTYGLSIYEKNQNILKYLGIYDTPRTFDYCQIANSAEYAGLPSKFIVVCPGASQIHRQWEPEKFINLINSLLSKNSYKVILVGNANEKNICQRIKENILDSKAVIDLCGKTTVKQLFSIISKSEFLISNDTGTSHIGGMLGIKTFIIAGKGDYGNYLPYPPDKEGKTVFSVFSDTDHSCFPCYWKMPCCGNNQKIIAQCVKDITVEKVYNLILQNAIKKGF